jgi:Rapamycin-insensitive companion of mTOR, domain 5
MQDSLKRKPNIGLMYFYLNFKGGIYQYVTVSELYMNIDTVFNEDKVDLKLAPHFFGCLSQTEAGCEFIQNIDDVEMMCKLLFNPPDLLQGMNLLKMKSSIWTLAHIGSSDYGFELLKKFSPKHVLEIIVEMIESCPIFSIRG